MDKKILFLITQPRTGTWCTRDMISSCPQVEPLPWELKNWDANIFQSKYDDEAIISNTIIATYDDFAMLSDKKYILVVSHVDGWWIRPTLLHQSFDYKLIVPFRHPYRVMRSMLWHSGDGNRSPRWGFVCLANYLELVYHVKAHDNVVKLPVDLLAEMPVSDRLDYIEKELWKIPLNITKEMRQYIRDWEVVNKTATKARRNLTAREIEEIIARVEISNIIQELSDIGINYEQDANILTAQDYSS